LRTRTLEHSAITSPRGRLRRTRNPPQKRTDAVGRLHPSPPCPPLIGSKEPQRRLSHRLGASTNFFSKLGCGFGTTQPTPSNELDPFSSSSESPRARLSKIKTIFRPTKRSEDDDDDGNGWPLRELVFCHDCSTPELSEHLRRGDERSAPWRRRVKRERERERAEGPIGAAAAEGIPVGQHTRTPVFLTVFD
jgi:hypothetical protein